MAIICTIRFLLSLRTQKFLMGKTLAFERQYMLLVHFTVLKCMTFILVLSIMWGVKRIVYRVTLVMDDAVIDWGLAFHIFHCRDQNAGQTRQTIFCLSRANQNITDNEIKFLAFCNFAALPFCLRRTKLGLLRIKLYRIPLWIVAR